MTREQLFKAMVGITEEQLEHSERERKIFLIRRLERRTVQKNFWIRWGAAAICLGVIGITAKQFSVQFLQEAGQEEHLTESDLEDWNLTENDRTGGIGGETGNDIESSSLLQVETVFTETEVVSEELKEISAISEAAEVTKILDDLEAEQGVFCINGVWYTAIRSEEWQTYGVTGERERDSEKGGAEQREQAASVSKRNFSEGVSVSQEELGEEIGVIEEWKDEAFADCTVYRYGSYPAEDICVVKVQDSYWLYTRCLQQAE